MYTKPTKITHYVVNYLTSGLSESINIWVTYLGIRQRLSHDRVNRIVVLDQVSYHLPPEHR
jgi:hypothetical protein